MTGAQRKIKAPPSCRIGADVGPVPGSLILGLCPAGRIMAEGRPEPPPRPRIGAQGGPSGKVKGWRRWPGSWPGPAAWIRAGNFDRGKRGTGADAWPSRAHGPQAAPRCAGRTGAPGRNGRSKPRPPAGSGPAVGPVAGSLALGLILGLCPGGGRAVPLAGSWPKDARSRRHGPGSGHRAGRPAR